MTFAQALDVLLDGGKVRRPSWAKSRHFKLDDVGNLVWGSQNAVMVSVTFMTATDWEEVKK